MKKHIVCIFIILFSFTFLSAVEGDEINKIVGIDATISTEMQIFVDATELPRKLLHSEITFNVINNATVLYPKWWPGNHGPVGSIENVAGLKFTDADGKTLNWERDWQNIYRFSIMGTVGNSTIKANLTYICNQQAVNATGSDGYPQIGIINWNTITLYPEGIPVRNITVQVKLLLPKGWQYCR